MKRLVVGIVLSGFAGATLERCRRDCRAAANETGQLESDGFHVRPVGPTRPPNTLVHPWLPAAGKTTSPSKTAEFCEAGCSFFFAQHPSNVTCKSECNATYTYDVSVGYNDLAEVALYECYDGCDMALRRCQPGNLPPHEPT